MKTADCKGLNQPGSNDVSNNDRPGAKILLVKKATLGSGNDELGRVLITGFFNTLAEHEAPPTKLFFINSGVTLTTTGSDIIPALNKLAEKGVDIFSCGTCLDYYNLKAALEVGKVGNMRDLIDSVLSNSVIYL